MGNRQLALGTVSSRAILDDGAFVAEGARVWHFAHLREHSVVGDGSIVGMGVYLDHDVEIGTNCKVGNYACLYYPAEIGDGVFIGPHALLLNDRYPRARNDDGSIVGPEDWKPRGVIVEDDVSIGAGAVIMAGVRLGRGCRVGAGSVVLADVHPGITVAGNPARPI